MKRWRATFLIGSISGMLAVIIFKRNLAAEASMLGYFGFINEDLYLSTPSAETLGELFRYPLAGFIYFDFFDIINVVLIAIMFIPVIFLLSGIQTSPSICLKKGIIYETRKKGK